MVAESKPRRKRSELFMLMYDKEQKRQEGDNDDGDMKYWWGELSEP